MHSIISRIWFWRVFVGVALGLFVVLLIVLWEFLPTTKIWRRSGATDAADITTGYEGSPPVWGSLLPTLKWESASGSFESVDRYPFQMLPPTTTNFAAQNPDTFLDFAVDEKNAVQPMGMETATWAAHAKLPLPTTAWTLPDLRFRRLGEVGPPEQAPHYGFYTGVYGVDTAPQDSAACIAACAADPFCHSCEFAADKGCLKSALRPQVVLKYFARDLLDRSPFQAGGTGVHLLVRDPFITTDLHASACDCNTLCSLAAVQGEAYPHDGATALGFLTGRGHFHAGAGDLAAARLTTRLMEWQSAHFCDDIVIACPPRAEAPTFLQDLANMISHDLRFYTTTDYMLKNFPIRMLTSVSLTNVNASEDAAAAAAVTTITPTSETNDGPIVDTAVAIEHYNIARAKNVVDKFHAAEGAKVCVCVGDPTGPSLDIGPTTALPSLDYSVFACPMRVPAVYDYDLNAFATGGPSRDPRVHFV